MGLIGSSQQLSCTFCQKSQQDAKKLIASPDKQTYICDECAVQPDRLKLISENSETLTSPFACSFCLKKQCLLGFYVSPLQTESRAQICRDCRDVCRRILRDEAKMPSVRRQRFSLG